MTLHNGILALQVRLVKVIHMLHETTPNRLQSKRRIRHNQHRNSPSTTSWSRSSTAVDGNVSCDDDSVATVPRRRLDPVGSVEKSISTSVAGVDGVDAFDVGVVVGEELHKHTLDGLGLVDEGFCADFEAADAVGVDVVFLEKRGYGSQSDGVDVCAVSVVYSGVDWLISPSLSSQKPMRFCPRPTTYLPCATPSWASKSD